MGSKMMKIIYKKSAVGKRSGEAGFSLVEVLFAAVILMVGLLSMVAVFGYAVAATQTVQEDQIAKQKAQELLENIFTARDTQQITFAQIANTRRRSFRAGLQSVVGYGAGWTGGNG